MRGRACLPAPARLITRHRPAPARLEAAGQPARPPDCPPPARAKPPGSLPAPACLPELPTFAKPHRVAHFCGRNPVFRAPSPQKWATRCSDARATPSGWAGARRRVVDHAMYRARRLAFPPACRVCPLLRHLTELPSFAVETVFFGRFRRKSGQLGAGGPGHCPQLPASAPPPTRANRPPRRRTTAHPRQPATPPTHHRRPAPTSHDCQPPPPSPAAHQPAPHPRSRRAATPDWHSNCVSANQTRKLPLALSV